MTGSIEVGASGRMRIKRSSKGHGILTDSIRPKRENGCFRHPGILPPICLTVMDCNKFKGHECLIDKKEGGILMCFTDVYI